MIGLLCPGKPDYDAIERFRDVPFFTHSPGNDSLENIAVCIEEGVDWLKLAQKEGIKESPPLAKARPSGADKQTGKLKVSPSSCVLFSM